MEKKLLLYGYAINFLYYNTHVGKIWTMEWWSNYFLHDNCMVHHIVASINPIVLSYGINMIRFY